MRQDVQQWFSTRSYHARQWTPEQLCGRKAGTRVSVVLPARDEAATVGRIVTALRRELVEDVALIDELVVIDSDSTDATAAVAAAAGARVHRQDEILPAHGNVPGKGEALWKSLAVTTGDVLAFVDADLREFDTRFVVGLLGPLLTEPGVQFVKSCYDRPLHDGTTILPAGGGRVTELVARPLLNLFWPQLSGLVQPLAGEYAGRRALLERVPFVSGYGVEIAMLIDVLEAVGLDAMAQVDLGVRSHRNSSDAALARMAAQIQLTVQARLRCEAPVAGESGQLTQFLRQGERFLAETHDVSVRERPPMAGIPEYRAQFVGRVA
ncbi:glucosyl-3-phosphoglycerate synthase [Kocuria turfanensis]|uniref:Glucosyl-3-phosphoglycerate synthase n=1 Tax=Kocuria turfanensis TaxID=388357 RepID=A0A512IDK0_9MICC|nr:glucosyl-3-phosphoglycerate synthase [Kocuria turfanensis]GEO95776.1 glucosyl-3-phosphoglycerate synthase [Kocuria turfanensis]